MPDFPSKQVIQKIMPWLIEHQRHQSPPLILVEDLRSKFNLSETEYQSIFRWFFKLKIWTPIGRDKLQLTEYTAEFARRFGNAGDHLDFNLLHRFANEREVMAMSLQVAISAARRKKACPTITLKALLEFGDRTAEGVLVESVGVPWFQIMKMISNDPDSIYQIDPFTREEIIAGAYDAAGFDEVILTPRSGDKGRDVIATKNGVGSIRIVDQVKAYNPGNLVPANDVRALAGVISMEQNVSKGIITTTSDFAPRVIEDDLIKNLIPYRLELRPKDDLLLWLEQVAGRAMNPTDGVG